MSKVGQKRFENRKDVSLDKERRLVRRQGSKQAKLHDQLFYGVKKNTPGGVRHQLPVGSILPNRKRSSTLRPGTPIKRRIQLSDLPDYYGPSDRNQLIISKYA